jgi:hypothetical protein
MEIESPMIRTLGNFRSSTGLSKGLVNGSDFPERGRQINTKKNENK